MENNYSYEKCKHKHLVPHTIRCGKQAWKDKNCAEGVIDWTSNVINAHYLRVVQYYCPECQKLIEVPKEAYDANKEKN